MPTENLTWSALLNLITKPPVNVGFDCIEFKEIKLINETEQEQDLQLQTLRTNQAQRLINETEQGRDLRLQTLRTYQEQRLINETEQ